MAAQNHKNHTRLDPGYLALMFLNVVLLIAAGFRLVRAYNAVHLILLGLALAVTSATIMIRRYALKNQDRVIRLEENVRLHWMGIDPSGLSMRQMIALRFAPDAEVPALVRRAVAEKLTGKQIKEAVVNWRADVDRV